MKKDSGRLNSTLIRQAVLIALSVAVLFGCRIFEEIQIKADGSGVYEAELIFEVGEGEMLDGVKKELASKPEYRILEEGERDGEKFVIIQRKFDRLEDLSDDSSEYTFSVSEKGLFSRSVQLEVKGKPGQGGPAPTEHLLTVKMPGKVVQTNGEKISRRAVSWNRLAAGPRGSLQVESRVSSISGSLAGPFRWAVVVLLAGVVLLVAVRIRRRPPARRCSKCGDSLSRGAKFCTKCGEAV